MEQENATWDDKVALIGAVGSGKTSYVSFSLACLQHLSSEGALPCTFCLESGGAKKQYLTDYPEAMRVGKWPERTQYMAEVKARVERRTGMSSLMSGVGGKFLRMERRWELIDVGGDFCRRIFQSFSHFSTILEKVRDARTYILMVDPQANPDLAEKWDIAAGIARIVHAGLERWGKVYVAIVFSKCDLLDPERYPVENRLEQLRNEFMERYAGYLSELFAKAEYEFFCVSCLPVAGHAREVPPCGRAATWEWSYHDLHEQLAPWKWIISCIC